MSERVRERASWLGRERISLDVCASTNDEALARARAGAAHGTIVTADAQTQGRGRRGRVWQSPPGANVYLSAIVRATPTDREGSPSRPVSPAEIAPITLAVGVGVVDAVRAEGLTAATLKWPNDVLVERRKLAGILCETATDAGAGARGEICVVVGIGVNLNRVAPEVAALATSIADEVGRPVDRARFVERLLACVEPWLDRFLVGGVAAIASAWEARMARELTLAAESAAGAISGAPIGLDHDGALRLRDAAGVIHRIHAGELALVDPSGPSSGVS
jgi:BirA family biotin operon repressor/biotin-[acetyl-CoA-carboxylase] ligase